MQESEDRKQGAQNSVLRIMFDHNVPMSASRADDNNSLLDGDDENQEKHTAF